MFLTFLARYHNYSEEGARQSQSSRALLSFIPPQKASPVFSNHFLAVGNVRAKTRYFLLSSNKIYRTKSKNEGTNLRLSIPQTVGFLSTQRRVRAFYALSLSYLTYSHLFRDAVHLAFKAHI